jgi:ZIP family zinc transporter
VLEATFWGFIAASTLLVGAGLAMARKWSTRSIGLVTGFGVGALISAVTLDLTEEAFALAGVPAVVIGLVAGALTFTAGNWLLTRNDNDRKRSGGQQAGSSALGIVLGTILDGIPESIVIGISLLEGQSVGIAFLAAVAISNLPEAMSATSGLLKSSWTRGRIVRLWLAVVAISAVAAGLGNVVLDTAPAGVIAIVEAFAAGAVLTMLADTMAPEAYENAGAAVGLATVAGYAAAALLTLV